MWDSLVESGGETLPAPTSPTPSAPVPVGDQKEVDKQMKVVVDLFSKYDFARVKSKRAVYYRPKGEGTFTRLYEEEFLVLVRDSYFSLFGKGEAKKVRDCRDTVKLMIKKQYDDLPDDLVQVSDNLFWDAESGTIEDHPPRPCFRRLFSTRFESKHVRRVAPFTVAQEQKLVARYNQFLQAYERGERPKNFDFVDTWANGDDDVYWDLMRAVAYCFLKKKPVGSYVLIGERRNGKSTFVGLLHTIFGTDNTSMVRLSQLGDPHYANRLTNTIMNAPDEEDEKAIDAQATFKGLALDTPILTDCGFKPMGEIKIGDVLYDRNFKPTAVVAKSETHYNPCYKIMFDNFQTVVADHEHRWVVSVDMDLEEVKTTEEIAELFKQGHEVYMPNVSPDPRPSGRTVLCDPYLYGVWLAKNGGGATEGVISGLRRDIRRYLKTRGVESDQKPNFSTPELRQALSMGIATKRILHGDLQTRLDMLRGYMDVLGFGSKDSYEVYARLDDKTLLPILQQLISSLGWATRVGLDRATRHSALFFTPNKQVFAVKQKLWLPMDRFDSRHRRVIEITPVETVPTQCVQVSSSTHTYLFGNDLKVTHNTIADHGLLTLSVMRSNEPLELQCNFMSFFPMNHMPEWKGTGAAACLSRSLVIPFFADLSARDSDNVNFAEATYTSDMLCEFLGEVLALAAYYSTHNLDFSQTMQSQQQGMEETMNSPFIYRDKFSRYFGGFATMALLYDDYCNWCRDNEYTIVPKKEFKFLWREYTRRSYRPEPLKGGKIVPIKVYAPANGLNGKQPFLASSYFDKLGTTSQLHEMGVSVVGAIEDLYEQATAPTIRLPFDKGENNG